MYPYPAGSSYVLQLLPPEAQEGGLHALLAQLRDPGGARRCAALVEEGSPDPNAPQSKVVLIGWGNVRISGTSNPGLKRFEGKSMDAAAAEDGITPFDLMVRCIEEDAGQTAIVMFQLDEERSCAPPARTGCTCSDRTGCRGQAPSRIRAPTAPSRASPAACCAEAAGFRWRTRCAA